jgi:PIN domain nuclease of toxin-antitoxin system
VKLLLDTHVWLWAVLEPDRLAHAAREAIENSRHALLVSAGSAWEIAIKHALGKLPLPEPPDTFVPRALAALGSGTAPLAITVQHAVASGALPNHHRDPFDRLLVAQAMCEGATLVTADHLLERYGAAVLWAGARAS